ncbi:MAG TPA: outer membrane beta-barrel protein [Vicinamibacterales bacterium]
MRTRPFFLFPSSFFLAAASLLLVPATASADITAFLGVNPTPTNRAARGISAGMGLVIVGFEVEYSNTSEDRPVFAPSLKTFMVNGLLQTPFPIAGMQFYGTAGAGGYRETLGEGTTKIQETNVGLNVGGGVKMNLLGPLRLRLDYRVFNLKGEPLHPQVQRFYAGVNLKF